MVFFRPPLTPMQSFQIKVEKSESFVKYFTNFRFDFIDLATGICPANFIREEIYGQRVWLAQPTVHQGLGDIKYC